MRDRFGFLAPLVLTLFGEPQHVRAWVRGAKGERVVGLLLDEIVAQEPGACGLHDRRFKGSRANLDHIVVCRVGVFVVDAKNDRGRIEVRGRWSSSSSLLWVGGRRAALAQRDYSVIEPSARSPGARRPTSSSAATPRTSKFRA